MELSIEGLSKRFGSKVAVDNISVTLQPGVYGLLGANRAGKTTLIAYGLRYSKTYLWKNFL